MKKLVAVLCMLWLGAMWAQAPAQAKADPLARLAFLDGNWIAKAQGPGGVAASGSYRFATELDGHVLARHSRTAECKAPSGFDCEHGDLLYVFAEGPAGALKAIYFDSEGHVLHYDVSTPTPTTAIFGTDSAMPGPQFRLVYELKDGVMSGRFQLKAPGSTEWRSYLEWSGGTA